MYYHHLTALNWLNFMENKDIEYKGHWYSESNAAIYYIGTNGIPYWYSHVFQTFEQAKLFIDHMIKCANASFYPDALKLTNSSLCKEVSINFPEVTYILDSGKEYL